ncbi:MAG: hypothetical protein ABSG64_03675 [Solirubrobacteraceae bacterium]|jgi:hypothetical protein
MATAQRRSRGTRQPPPPGSGLAKRLVYAWRVLAREQRGAALAALALWVTMFLPWYSRSEFVIVNKTPRPAAYNVTAYGAFSFVEAAVLLVSVAVLVLLFARAEERAFHLPGGDGAIVSLAGAWVALLIFYRMLDKPGTSRIAAATTTIGIQWGIFFALFAAIFLTYQGLRMRAAHVREPALAEDPTVPREVRRTSSYDQGLAASAADDLRRAREERRRAREADGG